MATEKQMANLKKEYRLTNLEVPRRCGNLTVKVASIQARQEKKTMRQLAEICKQ